MSWWIWAGIGGILLLGSRAAAGVADMSTPENFVKAMREALGVVHPGLGELAQQIVTAHAALESGWGRSRPAQLGNNLFNVTRVKGDTRPVIESGDQECDANGVCRPITQRFAAYGSLAEGLADYFRLISGGRYAPAYGALEAGDWENFVVRLREGGYYTLPLEQYRQTFGGVLAGVKKRWG